MTAVKFEIFDPNRRFTKAEAEQLESEMGMKFIAVQRIEEAEACYVIDPICFRKGSVPLPKERHERHQ